ncbi:hypothetical protein ACVWZL_005843 [Bradyrhizobium sp. GM2.4]
MYSVKYAADPCGFELAGRHAVLSHRNTRRLPMRSVISAIIDALKSAFGAMLSLVSAPFRAIVGSSGSGPMAVQEVAPARPPSPVLALDNTEFYKKLAIAMQKWAADSLLADERLPVPARWPRSVKEWAGGLEREELFAVIDGPQRAVETHLEGVFAMPRLRKVQPLQASPWLPAQPMPDPMSGTGSFFTAAAAADGPA